MSVWPNTKEPLGERGMVQSFESHSLLDLTGSCIDQLPPLVRMPRMCNAVAVGAGFIRVCAKWIPTVRCSPCRYLYAREVVIEDTGDEMLDSGQESIELVGLVGWLCN